MSADDPKARGIRIEVARIDLYCEHCWQQYNFANKTAIFEEYFKGSLKLDCRDCGNTMDLWNATLKSIKKTEVNTIDEICSPIGAQKTFLQTLLPAAQITEVIFAETGIPENATILNINYNTTYTGEAPTGTVGAVEVYSNPMERRINPLKASFYGIPSGTPPYTAANLFIQITWLPHTSDDIGWEYLVNAFLYYIDDRYHGAVLSANAAVETLLGKLMIDFLRGKASKDNIEQFLKNGATYSNQLNILLPAFLSGTDIPLLPEHVRGALNGLRNLRNALAHGSVTPQSVTADRAAEALCAAVFGNYYINYAGPLLLEAHIDQTP
jgi:hypothetical protein